MRLANPGKVTDATQGNGTTSHLTSELFQMMGACEAAECVPYRGSAPALNDLVAGSVDCMFDNLGVSLPLVKAGKLKLIAIAAPQAHGEPARHADHRRNFAGLFEAAALVRLRRTGAYAGRRRREGQCPASTEALRDPEILKRLADLSAEPVGGSLPETVTYFREETARWKERDHLGACDAGLIQFKNPCRNPRYRRRQRSCR